MTQTRDALVSVLAGVHGEPHLLAAPGGARLPALVRQPDSPGGPDPDPEALLGPLMPDTRAFPATSPELQRLHARSAKLWNGPTYVLRGFDADGRLACAAGRYFDAVTTCFELRAEARDALSRFPADPAAAWQAMPRRRALYAGRTHEALNDWLWRGEDRSASLSISCLLLVRAADGWRYGVARRAADLADEPGLNHVVPSMAFQPVDAQADSGYSITDSVLRELAEELFSVPEGGAWRALPAIADLQARLTAGSAHHRLTGLILNLEDLRPEILTLLWIPDPAWLARFGGEMALCRNEYATAQSGLQLIDDVAWRTLPAAFGDGRGTLAGTACVTLGALPARDLMST
jgi:hypothetical protein